MRARVDDALTRPASSRAAALSSARSKRTSRAHVVAPPPHGSTTARAPAAATVDEPPMSRAPLHNALDDVAAAASASSLRLSVVLLEDESPPSPDRAPDREPLVRVLSAAQLQRVRHFVASLSPPRAKRPSFHRAQEGVALKRSRVAADLDARPQRPRPLSMPALRPATHEPFWGTVLPPPTAQHAPSTPSPRPFSDRPAAVARPEALPDPRDDARFRPLFQPKAPAAAAADQPSPLVAPVRTRAVAALAPRQFAQSPVFSQSQQHTPEPPPPRVASPAGSPPYARDRSPFAARPESMPALPRLPSTALSRLPMRAAPTATTAALPALRALAQQQPALRAGAPLPPPRDLYDAPAPALFSGGAEYARASSGGSGGGGAASASSGAPQYDCPQCEATFRRRSDRNRHVRVVHEKQRPFACPTCQNRFGEKSNMLKHVRMVHENIRHFRCPHCDAAFGQRGNCDAHVRAVHEKRPGKYECAVLACTRAFARKAHLLDHYAAEHPGVPPPVARARPRSAAPPRTASAPSQAPASVFESAARSLLHSGFRSQSQPHPALQPAPHTALFDAPPPASAPPSTAAASWQRRASDTAPRGAGRGRGE